MIPQLDMAAGCGMDKLFTSNGSQFGGQAAGNSKMPGASGRSRALAWCDAGGRYKD
jgi:hypothetical protein